MILMKTFEDSIKIPIKWSFSCDGQILRSTVVGIYQAEIYKGVLTIITYGGINVGTYKVGTRRYGMIKARKVLSQLLMSKNI